MKDDEHASSLPAGNAPAGRRMGGKGRRRHRWLRWLAVIVLLLVVAGGITRAFLPRALRHFANRTLDRNLTYEGRIGQVELRLLHGAYSLRDIHIRRRTGSVPVPFFAAKRVDFTVQWSALLHGRIVGQFLLREPEINFVAASDENEAQTGAGAPWLAMIRELSPFTINRAVVEEGSLHFLSYASPRPVDVYLSHLNGTIDDLSNIRDQTKPLVTTVQATAMAMDQAKLELKMSLDPFSYRPTFHLALRMLGLDVTKLNDLALTYGKFDFKRGWFDVVLEADSKEGQIRGYVKPLFRNLKIFSLSQDIKEDSVLQFFWQALVGLAGAVLKNVPHDQLGTVIPFTGDATGSTTADILATVGNLLRNAFIRAYLPRLEPMPSTHQDLHFEAPGLIESLSTTAVEVE